MDNNFPLVSQPPNFDRSLFNHQRTSIYEMEILEQNKSVNVNSVYNLETNFGIQADSTGYGKTASMIGLLVRDKMNWDIEIPHFIEEPYHTNDSYKIIKKFSLRRIPTNLIVISQSLVSQWKEEIERSDLTYDIVRTRKKAGSIKVEDFNIVLCTPTMYNKLLIRYKTVAWKRLLYDEPGTTQIPSMTKIYTGFTWFITATPELLKWRYSNRRSHYIAKMALHYLENIFFKALQVKNPQEYVEASYSMPAVHHFYYPCYQPISRAVIGFVPKRVEIMIAAGNIRGAIRYLGGSETDNLINLVKSRFKEELDEAEHKIRRYTTRGDRERIDEWVEKKSRIENKLQELEIRFKDALKGNCNICFEKLNKPALVPCCHQLFCGQCIMTWFGRNNSCPLCRKDISGAQLVYINEEKDQIVSPSENISKTKQIVKIIQDNKKGKFIIFSDEDATYLNIYDELSKVNISCKEIKGRSESREKLIKAFKTGKSNVIFLNSRNNGAGINLQECTDIILYHQMEISTETQILGRANRIGRTKELNIHYLQVAE